jgi:hypothetical protein
MMQHCLPLPYHFLSLSIVNQSLKSGNVFASQSKFPSDVSALQPFSPQNGNDERCSSVLCGISSRDRYLSYRKGGPESCCS